MTALSTQITYFMNRVLYINKHIGGKSAYHSMDKNKDKFLVMKEQCMTGFHFIKEKLKEKEKKRVGAEHIKIDNEINDKLSELELLLERMNDYLKKAKNPSEKNMQTYEFLRTQWLNYRELMDGAPMDSSRSGKGDLSLTITDIRSGLLDDAPSKKKGNKRVRKEDKPATTMQLETMERWKKNDQKIDEQVGNLIDKTQQWKLKTIKMGEAIDQTTKQIDTLTNKVEDVNKDLTKANKQLKSIVEKFRKPHRCCLDVFLVLILVGLIVGIVHYAKK